MVIIKSQCLEVKSVLVSTIFILNYTDSRTKYRKKNSRWFEPLPPTHQLSVPFIIPLSILTLELPLTWGIQLPYAYFLAPYNVAFTSQNNTIVFLKYTVVCKVIRQLYCTSSLHPFRFSRLWYQEKLHSGTLTSTVYQACLSLALYTCSPIADIMMVCLLENNNDKCQSKQSREKVIFVIQPLPSLTEIQKQLNHDQILPCMFLGYILIIVSLKADEFLINQSHIQAKLSVNWAQVHQHVVYKFKSILASNLYPHIILKIC